MIPLMLFLKQLFYVFVLPFCFIEAKILELIAKQKTTKAIAELLFMSEKTVEGHRANIIAKLNLPQEKNALMKWAIRNL